MRIRGVVTWQSAPLDGSFVVDDGTQGIGVDYFMAVERHVWKVAELTRHDCEPGALVEVVGVTDPGGFAPVILPTGVTRVGSAPLPPPRRVPTEQLLSGNEDAQRIEVQGVIHAVYAPDWRGVVTLSLLVDGHPCRVMVERGRDLNPAALVDAEVRVRGVLAPIFNLRSQFSGLKINAMDANDLEVLVRPPPNPFLAPRVRLDRFLPFSPHWQPLHRKVARGVVTFARPGEFFFLQEGNLGARVQSAEAEVRVGEEVEVAGFVETAHTLASLGNGVVRSLGPGAAPVPLAVGAREVAHPSFRHPSQGAAAMDYSGRLLRIPGILLKVERTEQGRPRALLLESEGQTFSAIPPAADLPGTSLREGAALSLTGVCELDFAETAAGNNTIAITGFRLWLRSPEDVQILHLPTWWTPQRLSAALCAAGFVILLGLAWNVVLRRLLRLRTERLEDVMRAHRDAELEYTSARAERLRLAVDLHDGIKQNLAAASFRVDAAVGHLPESPTAAGVQLATALSTLLRTQTELEECLWGLHAVAEGPPDFVELLRHVTTRAEHWPKGAVTIESAGQPRNLSRDVAGSLLLLFQEATSNAFRHGHASAVTVTVYYAGEALELRIVDDGIGFDPHTAPGPRGGHFGIDGMKKRMHWLGGALHITAHEGGGMEICARLPWSARPAAELPGPATLSAHGIGRRRDA